MNEKPILFSGPMVREILEGGKTQTRRVVKPQPDDEDYGLDTKCQWYAPTIVVNGMEEPGPEVFGFSSLERGWKCPYGAPGDRLWVRETWAHDDPDCKDIRCGNRDHIWWKANETKIVADSFAGDAHWRSSIHMPRWASRITLEIVNVRVERVQEIAGKDVAAEGVAFPDATSIATTGVRWAPFRDLWDSINASRGCGWNVNPWVWVIEFKVAQS